MRYFFILAISIIMYSCSQEKNNSKLILEKYSSSNDTLPTFYIYGELPPENYIDDENPITEKYGFKLKRVAGCVIESDEQAEINEHNNRVFDYMNKTYGSNWKQQFENETHLKLTIPF